MMAQVLQWMQDFTFTPSMGQWRFSSGLPASSTATFHSGLRCTSS